MQEKFSICFKKILKVHFSLLYFPCLARYPLLNWNGWNGFCTAYRELLSVCFRGARTTDNE